MQFVTKGPTASTEVLRRRGRRNATQPLVKSAPLLLALALSLPQADAATFDLLRPEWRSAWLASTDKDPPLKVAFHADKPGMTVSRPGGLFNPAILSAHFGTKGPLPAGDPTPPQVVLANIGDTIGLRVVLSFNKEACQGLGTPLRLSLANSRGTRQTAPLSVLENDFFRDDTAWCLHYGHGKFAWALYQRPASPGPALKSQIPTSITSTARVQSWNTQAPTGLFKPGVPVEAIFSLTRSGPEELKVYGFIASNEVEHTVSKVTDFTFDTLYMHYPNGASAPGASFTIREFQLMIPGK